LSHLAEFLWVTSTLASSLQSALRYSSLVRRSAMALVLPEDAHVAVLPALPSPAGSRFSQRWNALSELWQAMLLEEQWYYAHERQRHGPVSRQQLQDLAAAGRLASTDMVLRAGTAKWLAAAAVPGLFSMNDQKTSAFPESAEPQAVATASYDSPAAAPRSDEVTRSGADAESLSFGLSCGVRATASRKRKPTQPGRPRLVTVQVNAQPARDRPGRPGSRKGP
jgi:hypothetical protein